MIKMSKRMGTKNRRRDGRRQALPVSEMWLYYGVAWKDGLNFAGGLSVGYNL